MNLAINGTPLCRQLVGRGSAIPRLASLPRTFLQCNPQRRQASSQRVRDHPSLYLHPIPKSNRFALSFLSEPPVFHEGSPTVIGYVNGSGADDIAPRNFEENPEWRPMLHEILRNVVWDDEVVKAQAENRIEGYIHIIDERNLPALNRAGEPEDLIASVLCRDGKLVPGHYEEGDAYRIVTTNGPTRLSKGLMEKVHEALEVARSIEEQMAQENAQDQ